MVTLPGQLAIKTIHGRNGDFNVGRLTTSIGEFVTKNADLDQYREGKYEGDFHIVEIRPSMYTIGGRMVIELRAVLGGMTLSNADRLSTDEAQRLSPEGQELDPAEEETRSQEAPPASPLPVQTAAATPSSNPRNDTAPFRPKRSAKPAPKAKGDAPSDDAALFGLLWPLSKVVKLDRTVDRRLLRQQSGRLGKLGYEFQPLLQEWHLKAA